jgi:hypothetical protein
MLGGRGAGPRQPPGSSLPCYWPCRAWEFSSRRSDMPTLPKSSSWRCRILPATLFTTAHTAILMREHGIGRICTRDTDFNRFPFLEVIDPLRSSEAYERTRTPVPTFVFLPGHPICDREYSDDPCVRTTCILFHVAYAICGYMQYNA